MEKTTLKKIIGAVRELKIKKNVNDSQFEFYNKKRHRIERKEKRMIAINNQIKQYLTNYVLIALVDKLNKARTFNYKKLNSDKKYIKCDFKN